MKSGSNMPGSSASEYLIYSYRRVPWERLTTSIRWYLAWKCLIFAHILSLFVATIPVSYYSKRKFYIIPYAIYIVPSHDKTNKMTCAPCEVSDQPGHPPSLISVFAMWRTNIYWCGQRRLWSDWEDAQADLSLRWAHMQYCWFCHVGAHFRSNFCQTPNIPLHIW